MLARRQRKFTPDEYLLLEERSTDTKSEFYDGSIYAMSGGSINHNRIVGNLQTELNLKLRATACEVFSSDVRLLVEKHTLFTYPDIIVVCGTLPLLEGRTDTLTDAKLIVEVLSPSTAHYDRGEKFQFYLGLPSLEEYVTVAQDQILVQRNRRSGRGWNMIEIGEETGSLELSSLQVSLPLEEIYRNVTFE